MNIDAPAATLSELVAAVRSELTRTDRRIAELILEEPTLVAFGTVSEIAERVGTSRPSVVRFANRLGFGGFSDLQAHVRENVTRRLSRPTERIRASEAERRPVRARLDSALDRVFAAVEGERLDRLAIPIARGEQVWILSGESSRAGAYALYSGLSMLRPSVRFVGSHTLGTDLSSAMPGDTAVVFDFQRYRRRVATAARVFRDLGVDIVAITDSPFSPLVELTETWCEIEIPDVGPFDSSVPSVALAELLVARVAGELREKAASRIDRIEQLWSATETFEEG